MAAGGNQHLQDAFLNHVRKAKVPVTIFLANGVKLQGSITWFDTFCILLTREGLSQLVYKHAISTIMPGEKVKLWQDGEPKPETEPKTEPKPEPKPETKPKPEPEQKTDSDPEPDAEAS